MMEVEQDIDPCDGQLDIWEVDVPVPLPALPTATRTVRNGQRGGSVAAASVPDAPEKYIKILRLLLMGPMTDETLGKMCEPTNRGTTCKRRLRLEQAGLVEDTGRKQHTTNRVPAIVWAITEHGRRVLAEWAMTED